MYVQTSGIAALAPQAQFAIWQRVRSFSDFSEDNNPYGERDFGAFDSEGAGKVFWKIDYYADASCSVGSEDPFDTRKTYRVLTVMLAGEY